MFFRSPWSLFSKYVPLNQYRILHNGLRYRVERKATRIRWGKSVDEWQLLSWCGEDGSLFSVPREFDIIKEAQECIGEFEALQRGWSVVAEYPKK